jgi:hypothetical protein
MDTIKLSSYVPLHPKIKTPHKRQRTKPKYKSLRHIWPLLNASLLTIMSYADGGDIVTYLPVKIRLFSPRNFEINFIRILLPLAFE